jgi:hypothetical protein
MNATLSRVAGHLRQLCRICACVYRKLNRVDDVMESPKLANDRAALFRSGRPGLALQVEVVA